MIEDENDAAPEQVDNIDMDDMKDALSDGNADLAKEEVKREEPAVETAQAGKSLIKESSVEEDVVVR